MNGRVSGDMEVIVEYAIHHRNDATREMIHEFDLMEKIAGPKVSFITSITQHQTFAEADSGFSKGVPTLKVGLRTYYLAIFSRQTARKLTKLDQERASLPP